MKPLLQKIGKFLNKSRDWLLLALVAGGIAFFMQKIQAEESKDPEAIWQDAYGQVVRPSPGAAIPGAETGPVDPANNIHDSLTRIKLEEIQPISTNPIFTPAEEYNKLVGRLKELRADFQAAQDVGDLKTAIDRLREYVKEDPTGKRLGGEWTTEPQQLLTNLVCNELQRTVEDTLTSTQELLNGINSVAQSEPYKALDDIDASVASIQKALADVDANPECSEDGRVSADRIAQIRQLQETLQVERKNLNERLVRQEYDRVFQQASALDVNTPPETVAQTIQAIQEFRTLLERQQEQILTQAQIDRLEEAGKKVEGNKESLIEQVKQTIDRISSDPEATSNLDRIEEILTQYDYLVLLGEPESRILSSRRKWDARADALRSQEAVDKMKAIIEELEKDLDQLASMVDSGEDPTALIARINGNITQIESMRKSTKGIRSQFQSEIRNQLNPLVAKFNTLKKSLNR